MSFKRTLWDRIEEEALDGDLVKALRLCLKLGGEAKSVELRRWATRELNGYDGDPELPGYRLTGAQLVVDTGTVGGFMRGQPISVWDLPDFAQDQMSNDVELRHPVAQMVSLAHSSEPLCFSPRGAAELVKLMNMSGNYVPNIIDLYWKVHPTTVAAVVDSIRTSLVGVVAELRAGMGDSEEMPSAELADRAIEIAVHGKSNRIMVHTASAMSSSGSIVVSDGEGERSWGWLKIVAGLATILGAVVAFVQLL